MRHMANIANAFMFVVLWECDQAREHQLNSLHFQIYDMDLNLAIQGFSPYGYEIVCLAFQLN